VTLRDYQQRAIDEVYQYFLDGNDGNPCIVMPTGSGKSHVIAAFCQDVLTRWPHQRILMLTHVKELIEQNAEKMRQHWHHAPLGIYSAGIGKRELGWPITFAGIQSVDRRAAELGHIDIILIDEAHLVNHRNQGRYRKLINDLSKINPALRVIGLTATPYRLGHGLITDAPALFDAILEPVDIIELITRGYLAPLKSKLTDAHLDTTGVTIRAGDYAKGELERAVNTVENNTTTVDEVIRLAGDRRAWLFFCAGVHHAQDVADELRSKDIPAACVTGDTPKAERERLLAEFKAGKLRALTNANVLTTGFDYPDIDLIAMLRPTQSPVLYVQMAGRGMRLKSHTDHCLVLDFAGNIMRHGPITHVQPPSKAGDGDGEAPAKACPECREIVHASIRVCPSCGYEFPKIERQDQARSNADIMGMEPEEAPVDRWEWDVYTSRNSGKTMLRCRYYCGLWHPVVAEYVTLTHDGYAGQKALKTIMAIAQGCGLDMRRFADELDLADLADALNQSPPPAVIEVQKDGKFYRVVNRRWDDDERRVHQEN